MRIAKLLRGRTDLFLPLQKILGILRIVLTCNNFEFNGTHFLQISGVSMGTKCAPTYTKLNMVLAVIEDEFLSTLPNKPKCWLKFIDDIFVIFYGIHTELETLVHNFNSIDPDIELTLEYSMDQVSFLDTIVFRQSNLLHTKLYKKQPTQPAISWPIRHTHQVALKASKAKP